MNHMIPQDERIRQGQITPRFGVFRVSRNQTSREHIKFAVCDLMSKQPLEVYEKEDEAQTQCNLLNIGVKLAPLNA